MKHGINNNSWRLLYLQLGKTVEAAMINELNCRVVSDNGLMRTMDQDACFGERHILKLIWFLSLQDLDLKDRRFGKSRLLQLCSFNTNIIHAIKQKYPHFKYKKIFWGELFPRYIETILTLIDHPTARCHYSDLKLSYVFFERNENENYDVDDETESDDDDEDAEIWNRVWENKAIEANEYHEKCAKEFLDEFKDVILKECDVVDIDYEYDESTAHRVLARIRKRCDKMTECYTLRMQSLMKIKETMSMND